MLKKNKELFLESVLKDINESKKLMPSRFATVQPVALMRLGLFLPSLKRKGSNTSLVNITASKELSSLEVARAEGYTDIRISGPRLSMETDFKVWVGVILAFAKYGLNGNTVRLTFSEFATFCGYSSKDKDQQLRERLSDSLSKLRGTTIKLSSEQNKKGVVSGLLSRGRWDEENDAMELVADESLWELYQIDRQVLVQMFILRKLVNKGTAQALYIFLESLPEKPIPLSFSRIKRRLMLTSPNHQQNRIVNKAINDLKNVGYLDGDIVKKDRDWHLIIAKRTPRPESTILVCL